ncbi:transducin beta-like protein 3 [Coccinella septempunctata]|uniref:transducin beta-like protein 3 n=1 Tax=Coccinella septempunctata TaxID=41139 RepID=UPI001D08A5CD|nr:transducin beta-like protein 3 [Coccinella septempunctata]
MVLQLKEQFEVESKHTAFYTGGNVEWHGDIFYCQTESAINLFNTADGKVSRTVGEENSEDADFIQTFTTDGSRIVSSHKSGLLKSWNESGELEKAWKYIHKGPIARLQLNGNLLASGGADGGVRIWDMEYHSCVSSFKECQGVVNALKFHPTEQEILASGDDGKIFHFEWKDGNFKKKYDKHFSKVTSIVFTHDNTHFISCGRDKVMILWKFMDNTPIKSIPFFESIDSIISLPLKFKLPGFKSDPECYYVAAAGEKGIITIWDVLNVTQIYVQDNSLVTPAEEGALAVSNLLLNKELKTVAVVTVEHNIILYHLKSFACVKQFIGFSDEIIDIAFMGQDDTHLAVATNSCDIKLYDNNTMNCQLLKGHTDIVLSLSVSKTNPNLLLSSSKDNTIRLWLSSIQVECIGVGKRHTDTVGSCCFSQTSARWAVSVGKDHCLKLWDIPSTKDDKLISLNCPKTELAHQDDINCVAVGPKDNIIGTASKDKKAKLWDENLRLIGVLNGHRKGVWCIRFSPVDQLAATSSADCSIKLWNLKDLTCCSNILIYDASVFNIRFISNGYQILSSGGDGNIQIVNIKDSKCQLSLEEHDGKVWGMAIKQDESMIVTGDSNSTLIKWKDVTEQKRLEKLKESEEQVLDEQKLNNYLQDRNWLKALKLALRLDKPFRVLNIVNEIIKSKEDGLKATIEQLREDQKNSLFTYAVNWNTNKKNRKASQIILEILLDQIIEGTFKPSNLSSNLEGALAYTQKYFDHSKESLKKCHFINYSMNCMKPHMKIKTQDI